MTLHIFPTARNIREYYTTFFNEVLPKCITIGEFESRAIIIKGKKSIDEDKRVLLLKQAADFSNFSKLNIPKEYLSFLKSSKFLFAFFDEIALEKVDIKSIDLADIYAEYETHLNILKQLLDNYEYLLKKHNYYDKTTLPKLYEINEDYIKNFSKIVLHLDGYLNSFEMELFKKISSMVATFEINYDTNIFTRKMIGRFKQFGFDLKIDKRYKLDLTQNRIIKSLDLKKSIKEVEFCAVAERVLQIGYIKKKVYDFLNDGIPPHKIVVITPDEEFATLIKRFDDNHIFNFAAGYSFGKSIIYKKIEALYRYLEERSYENIYRLKRYFGEDCEFESYHYKRFKEVDFDSLIKMFINEDDNSEEIKIFKKEIYRFGVLKHELKDNFLKDVLYLLLLRLKKNRLDDRGGGKITVMGLLESRLGRYDGVIVVDFNESIVPKKDSSDMFLNTMVRKYANLPTTKDRENLQKNYYFKLFLNAKRVAISALSNEIEKPSKFLDELPISHIKYCQIQEHLKDILLKDRVFYVRKSKEDLKFSFDFKDFIFSATSFKIFLECKRRFYYQYVKKIKEAAIPSSIIDEKSIGDIVHLSLNRLFKKKKVYTTKKQMRDSLREILNSLKNDDIEFWIDLWSKKLYNFIENEFYRYENGYRFHIGELPLKGDINGFNIRGVIDRIDKKGDEYILLDYKTGKIDITTPKTINSTTNYQMEFYYILAKQNGYDSIGEVGYYDLNEGVVVQEKLLKEKIDLLKEKFEQFNQKEYNFSMSEQLKVCKYCPYIKLCGRDV